MIDDNTQCTVRVSDNDVGSQIGLTGVVVFSDGQKCSLAMLEKYESCSVSILGKVVGEHTVSANYTGDSGHEGSSASLVIRVNKKPTSTIVTCSPSTVGAEQTLVYCSATVTDNSNNTIVPTGTVSMMWDGPRNLQSAVTCNLVAGSSVPTALCTIVYLPTILADGVHTVTVTYAGDSTHLGSTGTSSVSVNIPKTKVVVTVVCPQQTLIVGENATCTVMIVGRAVEGSASIILSSTNGGTAQPRPSACSLQDGICNIAVTGTSAGTLSIEASYEGDAYDLPGQGSSELTFENPVSQRSTDLVAQLGLIVYVLPIAVLVLALVSVGIILVARGTRRTAREDHAWKVASNFQDDDSLDI